MSKVRFEAGQMVRVVDGPFNDFNGVVEEVNYEKSRLRVAVLIFGRSTPVELEFGKVEIPFEMVKDPEALKNWPLTLSRDGARTPLPWAAGESHAGFSSVDPWLPLGAAHGALAVDRQHDDPAYLIHLTRRPVDSRVGTERVRAGNTRGWRDYIK